MAESPAANAPVPAASSNADPASSRPAKPVELAMNDDQDRTIVVTGQRPKGELTGERSSVGVLGDVDILDTPFSVQSYNEQLIRDTQALTVSDVLQRDASFTVRSTSSRASPWDDFSTVRGFQIANNESASINGLFGLAGLTPSVESVSRIDLLKGPSAFLTGAPASVGGTIGFTTKRASPGGVTRVGANFLSDSIVGGDGELARRSADGRFGFVVSGAYREGGTVIGDGHLRRDNIALGLDADLGKVRLSADVLHEDNRNSGYNYYLSFGPTYPIETGLPHTVDGRIGVQPPWMTYYTHNTVALGRAEWNFAPGWTASASYGHSWFRSGYDSYCFNQLRGRDGTVDCYVYGNFGRTPTDSADVRLSGSFNTGPLTHHVIAGANRVDQSDFYASTEFPQSFVFNIYDSVRPPKPAFPVAGPKLPYSNRTFKSFFVGDTIGVANDLVTATIGVRRAQINATSYVYGTGEFDAMVTGAKWTPAFAATVQPSDHVTLYGNYVQALEPGAVAPTNAANAGEVFPPLVSKQVEFGAKARIGGLTATAAWFRISKALAYLSSRTNPPTYVQDGRQVNKGVELGLNGEVARGLRVIASASWITARQQDTDAGLFDGKRVASVPKWAARALAEWDVPAIDGLTLIGGVNHTGRTPFDNANTFDLPSWTKFEAGARLAFRAVGTDLVARLSIDNLTDKRFWVSGYDGGFAPATPRNVAISLSAAF